MTKTIMCFDGQFITVIKHGRTEKKNLQKSLSLLC